MFKFHKIGNKVASGWMCLISSEEELKAHLEYMGRRVWKNWIDIKDSPEDKDGHCKTNEASVYKGLLFSHIDLEGKDTTAHFRGENKKHKAKTMSMPDCISYLSKISTQSAINIFLQNEEVYVSKNGACRPSTKIYDYESILERQKSKSYIYPTISKDEFDIKKWQGGNHFYILQNGTSIAIDKQFKWNTVGAAQDALNKHWKRTKN